VRVVIDTNILISGLISSSGPPAKIVNALLKGDLIPVMSEATLAELEAVLRRPRLQPYFTRAGVNPALFLADFHKVAQFVTPRPVSTPIRDEKDRPFLELMASNPVPEFFVTGDKDFEEQRHQNVPVISASLFVDMLRKP
jgi:hypothetical protein